jgi:membrane protein DedA with SNARE-associated domain
MFAGFISSLAGWLIGIISATGYFGVAMLMALESACIPLPSEVIMPFAGYLVSIGRLNLLLVATAGAIGCNLGSAIAYEIGRRGGRPLITRFGRYVLMSEKDLDWAERFFARYGGFAVLVARVLPGIRSFIAFPAGIARMPLLRFHIFTFLGSWPWCFGLAYLGMVLGKRWHSDPRVAAILHQFDAALVVIAVAAAVWFVWHRWRRM